MEKGSVRACAARAARLRWGVIFFFGFGTKQRDEGPGEVRTCPNCGNTSQWARVREVRQFTVFFLPIARWGRRHFEVCGVCGIAVEA